jgi:hypothetical protein
MEGLGIAWRHGALSVMPVMMRSVADQKHCLPQALVLQKWEPGTY